MKKIGRSDAVRDSSLHRIKNPKQLNRSAKLNSAQSDCLNCFEACANLFCSDTCKSEYKKNARE